MSMAMRSRAMLFRDAAEGCDDCGKGKLAVVLRAFADGEEHMANAVLSLAAYDPEMPDAEVAKLRAKVNSL